MRNWHTSTETFCGLALEFLHNSMVGQQWVQWQVQHYLQVDMPASPRVSQGMFPELQKKSLFE